VLRQEELEFKASVGYVVRFCLKKKKKKSTKKPPKQQQKTPTTRPLSKGNSSCRIQGKAGQPGLRKDWNQNTSRTFSKS
jgi:hypothetical protein